MPTMDKIEIIFMNGKKLSGNRWLLFLYVKATDGKKRNCANVIKLCKHFL